ncbi:DoxX family protein [Pedobacter sandarakinus]|uniref:DoxX family protein n=1 Tax=Pedobacter sandarakinus TaxID=353156 RepID=UPI002245EF18|nr:DoxX family protein [Pedobacter sandarakinus]MCX2575609.1 DoxX family protein [Pedobacter sandarakinus]
MNKTFIWAVRLLAAIILLQTLFFKFSAAPVSVFIFRELGLEPHGRIGIGILELIASALILIPKTTIYGAVLGLGLMVGAIFSHLTQLGIVVQNDMGKLFMLACIVSICCITLIANDRQKLLDFIKSK